MERGLLELPLLVQGHILSYLTTKEQLNLRQVCRETKAWIDRSPSTISRNIHATLLNKNGRPFSLFLKRNQAVPSCHLITTLRMENESVDVFDDTGMPEFLRLHSHFITALHLKRFYVCGVNGNQKRFFRALSNLRSLELDEVWIASSGNTEESTRVPEGFGSLTALKLGRTVVYNESSGEVLTTFSEDAIPELDLSMMRWYISDLLWSCPQLNFYRVPVAPSGLFAEPSRECVQLLHYLVDVAARWRQQEGDVVAGGGNNFRFHCDLNGFHSSCEQLKTLLMWFSHNRFRVQFLNVDSKFFKLGSTFVLNGPEDYVESLFYTHMVNARRMVNVRKLTIVGSRVQKHSFVENYDATEIFLNLEEVSIVLDVGFNISGENQNVGENNGEVELVPPCITRVNNALLILFPAGATYSRIQTLSITFIEPVDNSQRKASPGKLSALPRIIGCLPALKNLSIAGWNGRRGSYLKLWQGFRQLEKLRIERCRGLNASCFIGGNGSPNRNANYQFFSELNFVEFIGLERMPKMTTSRRRLGMNVLSKFGLKPLSLRTSNETDRPRNAVWIRSPRPVVMEEATMS